MGFDFDMDFSWNPFGKFLIFVMVMAGIGMAIAAGMMLK